MHTVTEPGTPAYWEELRALERRCADAYATRDGAPYMAALRMLHGRYGTRGLTDLPALMLEQTRRIDPAAPGRDLVARALHNAVPAIVHADGRTTQTPAAPGQDGAMGHAAAVLAGAVELQPCHGLDAAAFLHDAFSGSDLAHHTIAASLAGNVYYRTQRSAAPPAGTAR